MWLFWPPWGVSLRMKLITQESQAKRRRVNSWYRLDPWIQLYLKQDTSLDFSTVQVNKFLFFHSTNNALALSKCPVLYRALRNNVIESRHGWPLRELARWSQRVFPLATIPTGVCRLDFCEECEQHSRWCSWEQFYGKCRDNLHVYFIYWSSAETEGTVLRCSLVKTALCESREM